MGRYFTALALILISTFSLGQETTYVNTTLLNVRSGAGTKYKAIEKIAQGEKVAVLSTEGDWSEIELSNGTRGYVTTKYLSTVDTTKIARSQGSKEIGFQYGFENGFKKVFLIVMLTFVSIEYYKSKRIKDRRYSKGYRELPFTMFEIIKFGLYSAIVAAIAGLFIGIVYWIKSF